MQRSLSHLAVFCLPGRWSWLLWGSPAHGFGFSLSPTAPVAAPGCQRCWRRMEDACREPGHTQHSPPVLPGLRVLPLLPLLFALLSACVSSPAEVAKGLNNRWEETKSLQWIIPDATVLMGKIFYYPVPAFAFQGMLTRYKVMLFNTFPGAILQQRHSFYVWNELTKNLLLENASDVLETGRTDGKNLTIIHCQCSSSLLSK